LFENEKPEFWLFEVPKVTGLEELISDIELLLLKDTPNELLLVVLVLFVVVLLLENPVFWLAFILEVAPNPVDDVEEVVVGFALKEPNVKVGADVVGLEAEEAAFVVAAVDDTDAEILRVEVVAAGLEEPNDTVFVEVPGAVVLVNPPNVVVVVFVVVDGFVSFCFPNEKVLDVDEVVAPPKVNFGASGFVVAVVSVEFLPKLNDGFAVVEGAVVEGAVAVLGLAKLRRFFVVSSLDGAVIEVVVFVSVVVTDPKLKDEAGAAAVVVAVAVVAGVVVAVADDPKLNVGVNVLIGDDDAG